MRLALLTCVFISVVAPSVYAEKYELDKAHTNISFTAPHLMVSKVRGEFEQFQGTFEFDEKSQKLDKINVSIKADSVNTHEADRDKHLRSPDFFDVTKFPELKFKSTKIHFENSKPDKIEGDLTIRGVTKNVTLDVDYKGAVTDPWGQRVIAFDAETKINRKDYGFIWNKAMDKGGVVVGDEIKISISGEAKAASAKAKK